MNGRYYGVVTEYNGLIGTIKCLNDSKEYKFSYDNLASEVDKNDYVVFTPEILTTQEINMNVARGVKCLSKLMGENGIQRKGK